MTDKKLKQMEERAESMENLAKTHHDSGIRKIFRIEAEKLRERIEKEKETP